MQKLFFRNFIFKDGLNLTVRKGTRWLGRKGYCLAKEVGGSKEIKIRIEQTKICRFEDILAKDIQLEHDPKCRFYKGLLKEMRKIYGNNFQENEQVTLVFFTIKGG